MRSRPDRADRLCRFCRAPLHVTFVDLHCSPLANSLLDRQQLNCMEPHYPLHAFVCEQCFLVQVEEFAPPERIFTDYAYFSSYSDSWLEHARVYCEAMIGRFGLTRDSLVIEIASNDGYLLQNFVERGIPVLGIEPAANVARVAEEKGIRTIVAFFDKCAAETLRQARSCADLICANNVLAHVPDINDFIEGCRVLLKPAGVATFEFPHLLSLMQQNQFDTIYHEHFSYLSLMTVERMFAAHGLTVFDVEQLSTHGGSLRIYACPRGARAVEDRLRLVRQLEAEAALDHITTYSGFADQVVRTKCEILSFFIEAKRAGKRIVGYGAPAKGNTLLNYCGIGREFVPFTVDRNPHKQGRFLPGSHIPIRAPDAVFEAKPDYILILPWNLKDEIINQMAGARECGARFVTLIPNVSIC